MTTVISKCLRCRSQSIHPSFHSSNPRDSVGSRSSSQSERRASIGNEKKSHKFPKTNENWNDGYGNKRTRQTPDGIRVFLWLQALCLPSQQTHEMHHLHGVQCLLGYDSFILPISFPCFSSTDHGVRGFKRCYYENVWAGLVYSVLRAHPLSMHT